MAMRNGSIWGDRAILVVSWKVAKSIVDEFGGISPGIKRQFVPLTGSASMAAEAVCEL